MFIGELLYFCSKIRLFKVETKRILMKKIVFCVITGALAFASCSHDFDFDDTAIINANSEKIFGLIDPRHDWNTINSGSITITADADLNDIVKVQILTESPFGNDEARVLNETAVSKGSTVTLLYDAPNIYKELIAACVDSKGEYYVKVFSLNDKEVSFASAAKARTRATNIDELPDASKIRLEYSNSKASFNAERAKLGAPFTIDGHVYEEWVGSNWDNDRLWTPSDVNLGVWTISNGNIYRTIENGYTAEEEKTVKTICDTYLKKYGGKGDHVTSNTNKRNNWETIATNSKYFNMYNNYLISNGSPVTLVPIQMNTTEGDWNYIYYYYYDPNVTANMTSEQEADYIKSLPKFRVVNGFKGNDKYKRDKEYLLPYYGDGNIGTGGTTAVSCSIPKGYRIGFLNRKRANGNYNYSKNGCTYGDGRLNFEVNHLRGHYFSAMDTSIGGLTPGGMNFTSPRIGIFSANKRIYMCFEDGADCNFCDMILEICQGAEVVNEDMEVQGAAYTMCFEDRPGQADYDLNDVVLRCVRKNETTLTLTLVAAGADDNVFLHGTKTEFDGKEVHEILGFTGEDADGHRFINTVIGGTERGVKSATVTVDPSMSIPKYMKGIYVVNGLNPARHIGIPENLGDSPCAIIVPDDFDYPKEQMCITTAYPNFLSWARDINVAGNWYKFEEAKDIFPSLFKK